MNFQELCTALENKLGKAPVFDSRHPTLGCSQDDARLVLWEHDREYDVGGPERGRFIVTKKFTTEEDACEYMFRKLTCPVDFIVQSPAEKENSLRITKEFTARFMQEGQTHSAPETEHLDP